MNSSLFAQPQQRAFSSTHSPDRLQPYDDRPAKRQCDGHLSPATLSFEQPGTTTPSTFLNKSDFVSLPENPVDFPWHDTFILPGDETLLEAANPDFYGFEPWLSHDVSTDGIDPVYYLGSSHWPQNAMPATAICFGMVGEF
jgi:hypothetical protein